MSIPTLEESIDIFLVSPVNLFLKSLKSVPVITCYCVGLVDCVVPPHLYL